MSGIAASLGPLKAIRGGRTPERPDVQTPKRANAQTLELPDVRTPGRLDGQVSERPQLPLQGTAKRSHPDFSKHTVYLRKRTLRDAMRKYEDSGGKEVSELVEDLLRQYIGRPNA